MAIVKLSQPFGTRLGLWNDHPETAEPVPSSTCKYGLPVNMHVTTGPPTTYEGLPGPGNKTFLVMFPAPTFTLVGKHPSSPSQHGSVPPMRDSFSSPQPEDTGALSPLRADRGGVATNQSPPPCGFSTAAQESSLSLPPAQPDPPPAAQILLELLDSGPALGSLEACLAELHRSG